MFRRGLGFITWGSPFVLPNVPSFRPAGSCRCGAPDLTSRSSAGSLLPALRPGRWPEGSRLDVLIGWKTGPVGIASGSDDEQRSHLRPGMRLHAPRSRQPRGRSVWPLPLRSLRVLKVCPFRETKPRYFPLPFGNISAENGQNPGVGGMGQHPGRNLTEITARRSPQ